MIWSVVVVVVQGDQLAYMLKYNISGYVQKQY